MVRTCCQNVAQKKNMSISSKRINIITDLMMDNDRKHKFYLKHEIIYTYIFTYDTYFKTRKKN